MEEESSLLRTVTSYSLELRSLLQSIINILILSTLTVFILYLPLGDPNQQCSGMSPARGSIFGNNPNHVANVYMCNAYRAMSITAMHTGNVVQKTVQFTSCVVLNALYDLKIKFYNLLEKVDRQDLCRSICCTEADEFHNIQTQTEEKRRTLCKCRGKCCRTKKI